MTIKFNEYAVATQQYSKYPTDVLDDALCLGVFSEMGEVASKYKKYLRGDNGGVLDLHAVALELSDVLFYLSQQWLQDWQDYPVPEPLPLETHVDIEIGFCGVMFEACELAGIAMLDQSYSTWLKLLCYVVALGHMCNCSSEQLMELNLSKLSARQMRGTIQGDGDNR